MNDNSRISYTVLRRVRIIHALRPILSFGVLAAALFVVSVWGISREVWVARVFENMPSLADVSAVVRFFFSAFVGTELLVQVLFVLAIGTCVWLARECVRLIGEMPRLA